jgi:hypothetical protein
MGLRDGETIQDVATVVADDAEPVIESAGGTEPEAEAPVLTETDTEAAPEAPAAS